LPGFEPPGNTPIGVGAIAKPNLILKFQLPSRHSPKELERYTPVLRGPISAQGAQPSVSAAPRNGSLLKPIPVAFSSANPAAGAAPRAIEISVFSACRDP